MKSLIALHGSYYGDNFGDTLFVQLFVEWIKEIGEYKAGNIVLPFASNRARKLVNVSDIKGIKSLIKSRCIIFIGGGYFGEPKPKAHIWHARLFVRHLSVALFSMALKKPYIFVGIGAGPLTNTITKKITVLVCNRSNKVVVRDIESKEYLIEYGVDNSKILVTADSVLSIQPRNLYDKNESEVVKIGIHLPSLVVHAGLSEVVTDLKKFCSSLDNYKLYSFKDFYKEGFQDAVEPILKDAFQGEKIEHIEYVNPNQLIDQIGKFDILLTNKLHVGIIGLTQKVHTVSFAIHPKVRRLYNQLGLSKYTVPLNEYKEGMLLEMLNNWQDNNQDIPKEIIDSAMKNKDIVKSFIQSIL